MIQHVTIIGLGALGILYAEHFTEHLPAQHVRVLADEARINKYKQQGVYANGQRCQLQYVTPQDDVPPADLIIFATKFNGLQDAIQLAKSHTHDNTIFLSVLNGITSELMLAETFGEQHVVYCVAQGMDAVKQHNALTYANKGVLVIGSKEAHTQPLLDVAAFFTAAKLPHFIDDDMMHRLWGKFMLNVGINQTVAMLEGTYATVQQQGKPRELMKNAMREVILIAQQEGIALSETDIDYWMDVISRLSPDGKPSMAQDVEAKRLSELPLFAGTVRAYGEKHNIPTPINDYLYAQISAKERNYTL